MADGRRFVLALLLSIGMSSATSSVAVIGGTGKLGRLAVEQLVRKNVPVRVLLRHDPAPASEASGAAEATAPQVAAWLKGMPGVTLVKGDVNDRESVSALLDGCSAVLALHGARRMRKVSDLWRDPSDEPTHSKQINYVGVQNIIDAARASGSCKRIVRVTGKGENPWSVFSILINGLGCMAKAWNYEGEQLLRACDDIEYTIVRPGVMGRVTLEPDSLALADNGGDLKVSPITHDAVASLCVSALDHPKAARSTLCAMTVPAGGGASSWAPLLAKVGPDTRSFRTDLFAESTRAVRTGAFAVLGVLATMISLLVQAIRAAAALLLAG